ncbi:MAG: ATP-binding response regulator [Actinomycetota bacterium]
MRILLVDDHSSIRRSLRQLLSLRPEFEVVGESQDGAEAVQHVESLEPDVVLMDMNMPEMGGVEATRMIKERHPEVQVLALTAFSDMSLVSSMVQAGAAGYLLKGGSSAELFESLEAVGRGQGALDKEVTRGVMDDMAVLYQREQDRANALEELDRMKSEFVSVVSHELRTPLTTIKGGVETLRNNWTSIREPLKFELLDSIARQCDRLARMINQILVVSGLQRGGLGLRPSVFSLARVAQEALDLLGGRASGRAIRVDLPGVQATGDRDRVREVAVALIENALIFTDGAVELATAVEEGMAKLHVVDEGPGLHPAKLTELMEEPFVQGDSSTTRTVGGLGLSLYIVRQVLEASGGRLEVETGPDRGSRFTMVLPTPPSV